MAGESIRQFTDSEFQNQIQSGLVLVDFHAHWCGPCRTLAPVLDQVAKELKGKAVIGKVDIDSEQKTAAHFQITSVPTMILFKNGKEVGRLVGLRTAEAIKEFIRSEM
ncbi:MAG: thioredoxin-related protein [uncultured bacterium]|nr:MAG: thioredoxin-related protein [uncultured bacterium]OGN55714.1 MAG: thioredoxin [Chlamydiae bacterium RIFCSPHIGHO2_01_FULL_44_39]OGN58871.1 MAG: thioredoxin [Chlamydiae bacterium RIFCSPHIGHO2_02_FULL_45_9]OGN60506.1 MAG: thioredoxin [Chlamydiae bacterium RIFCSPHIGHO2_12_FULL_44_59]OGN65960.1 MAG: thioredoxin [Chlamydiae bacterium RIFCSPLOWO2_01_FULL_44_52]OGN68775.1 MAG: thioredoxin [Chlamydiae bacterium RIFCSPLOWO2_02_FULL_45_22]OGN70416.1 MAG: thioredoxin [Chlamydiae bacterium RIFCSPL